MRIILALFLIPMYIEPACLPVVGEKILASDLVGPVPEFATADPKQVISFAPLPGAIRNFPAKEIGLIAQRMGVVVEVSALKDICFQSVVHTLTREDILAALIHTAQIPESNIEVLDFGRSALPPGILQFELSGLSRPPRLSPETPVIWRGRLISESGRSFPVWVKVRMVVESPVLIAAVTLRKGQLVRPDQVTVETRKQFPFLQGVVTNSSQASGMAPKQDIVAGQMILLSTLEKPREVSQGDNVRVDVTSGEAQISFEAKAQTGGRNGDTILLLNPTNGHVFRGVVVESGRVEVKAMAKDVQGGN